MFFNENPWSPPLYNSSCLSVEQYSTAQHAPLKCGLSMWDCRGPFEVLSCGCFLCV